MRVIARRERPRPGAATITDADDWRITLFATNLSGGRIAEHELLHRQRARAGDRIRCLKDTGLRNLPLHEFTANQVWLELVALAHDLLAWTQHLALADTHDRHLGARREQPGSVRRQGPSEARTVSVADRSTGRASRSSGQAGFQFPVVVEEWLVLARLAICVAVSLIESPSVDVVPGHVHFEQLPAARSSRILGGRQ